MAQILYAIIVVLSYRRTVAALIAFAQMVVQKMTNNAYFPTATATLASTTSAITAYQTAVSSSGTTKGLKGQRESTKGELVELLKQLRDIVRAAAQASPENALAIVQSAGMSLLKRGGKVKELIAVIQGALSGSVTCIAKVPFPGVRVSRHRERVFRGIVSAGSAAS
jgi:hypothetical protein